ncbi:MAG: QueT transporter family protein [Eubacteriales bacterium]|nr:QueT transporter family protein [Eubacteriales bacterium]
MKKKNGASWQGLTKENALRLLIVNAILAALYVVITLAIAPLSYGPIQFRFAELLTWTAWLNPYCVPGVTIGCFLANIGSPFGIVDMIFGTAGTLFTCVMMSRSRHILVAAIWPTVGILFVGLEFVVLGGWQAAFILETLQIMLSEFLLTAVIGAPLIRAIYKHPLVLKLRKIGFSTIRG